MRCMLLHSARAGFTNIIGGYSIQRYCCLNGKPWERPIYIYKPVGGIFTQINQYIYLFIFIFIQFRFR